MENSFKKRYTPYRLSASALFLCRSYHALGGYYGYHREPGACSIASLLLFPGLLQTPSSPLIRSDTVRVVVVVPTGHDVVISRMIAVSGRIDGISVQGIRRCPAASAIIAHAGAADAHWGQFGSALDGTKLVAVVAAV